MFEMQKTQSHLVTLHTMESYGVYVVESILHFLSWVLPDLMVTREHRRWPTSIGPLLGVCAKPAPVSVL